MSERILRRFIREALRYRPPRRKFEADRLDGLVSQIVRGVMRMVNERRNTRLFKTSLGPYLWTLSPEEQEFFVDLEIIHDDTREFNIDGYVSGTRLGDVGLVLEIYIQEDHPKEELMYPAIVDELKDVVRHELEHLADEEEFSPLGRVPPPETDYEKDFEYFIQPSELGPFVMGFYKKAQRWNVPISEVMHHYLRNYVRLGRISRDEEREIVETWLDWALENRRKFMRKDLIR